MRNSREHSEDELVQCYLFRDLSRRISHLSQHNRIKKFEIKKNVAFQPAEQFDSRPNLAQISVSHSDFAVVKPLNDLSFSIRENVSSHIDSGDSTIGKNINVLRTRTL